MFSKQNIIRFTVFDVNNKPIYSKFSLSNPYFGRIGEKVHVYNCINLRCFIDHFQLEIFTWMEFVELAMFSPNENACAYGFEGEVSTRRRIAAGRYWLQNFKFLPEQKKR